jgi:hypothetical protein
MCVGNGSLLRVRPFIIARRYTYAGFAVEDLGLRGMMRTRMAGSLADAGLGAFV